MCPTSVAPEGSVSLHVTHFLVEIKITLFSFEAGGMFHQATSM